jgi:hypothetical protein
MDGLDKKRRVATDDEHLQFELTSVIFDGAEKTDQQHLISKNVETGSDSSKNFDTQHLNLNQGKTLGQSQMILSVQNSDDVPGSFTKNHNRLIATHSGASVLTTKNSINDIKPELDPIVGYAAEPLLPLSKACAPLETIVYNLSAGVKLALDETSEQPSDGLTIDESAAIRLYTMEWNRPHRSLYSMLNQTLKESNRENLRPYLKYLKLLLTALVKLPCMPQQTVWRGVTKDLSEQCPLGTIVTWWTFSSCTAEMSVLTNDMYLGNTGSRTLFSVEAINSRAIRAHSHFPNEDEILLLPGTHMVVQSQLSPAPDLHIIHLKQVVSEKVLLEPPFEGILNILHRLV